MTRSGVVLRLESCVNALLVNGGLTEIGAEKLLTYLERLGMKPPCCADFGGHRTLNEFNECEDYIECCNFRWEPETKEENTK